jgi:1-acyl-sn-glycerol-3-phosphate acyltransferase
MDWQFKTARDHALTPRERLASLKREGGLASLACHWLWRQVIRFYLRAFHRLSVTGLDNLPEPPFVMVANHASHLDILALATVLPARYLERVHPIAADDAFFSSFASSVFAAFAVNAFPLKRKAARPKDLALLRARLVEDRLIYILFPEGTRSRDGQMAPFKAGIGALLAASEVPVVPCFLAGAFAALPAHRRLPLPRPLRLSLGKPLSFAQSANDRAGWFAVAQTCESEVRRLEQDRIGLNRADP